MSTEQLYVQYMDAAYAAKDPATYQQCIRMAERVLKCGGQAEAEVGVENLKAA